MFVFDMSKYVAYTQPKILFPRYFLKEFSVVVDLLSSTSYTFSLFLLLENKYPRLWRLFV